MSDQQTTTLDRESRIRQFLIFVLLTGTGMLTGFDLAENSRPIVRRHIDRIAEVEQYVQHLWVYAPIGTAAGVAAGFVFGYALRRATWGELSILAVLGALVLGFGMLMYASCCLFLAGIFSGAVAIVLGVLRRTS